MGVTRERLIDELAEQIAIDEATALLQQAQFPSGEIPNARTARIFWTDAVHKAAGGACPGGIRAIVDQACRVRPHNQVFQDYREHGEVESTPTPDHGHQRETVRLSIEYEGTVGDMLEILAAASNDSSIKVLKVEVGSMILTLDMTTAGAEELSKLWASGQLSDRLGHAVSSFERLDVIPIRGRRPVLVHPLTDRQRLERWRAGDRDAGNALVRAFHGTVYAFFRNSVAQPKQPSLVQETFERFRSGAVGLDMETSIRIHLFRIARMVLNEHLRDRFGTKDFDPSNQSIDELGDAPPSHERVERQRAQQVLTNLRALAADAKLVLELHHWHGCTTEELGTIFDKTTAEVERWLHTAESNLGDRVRRDSTSEEPRQPSIGEELRTLGTYLAG